MDSLRMTGCHTQSNCIPTSQLVRVTLIQCHGWALIIGLEWVSHDLSTQVTWGTSNLSNIVYHQVAPANPRPMIDNANSAEDATGYYASPQVR
jgi:hypothetical protein